MTGPIPINLAFEDALIESLIKKIFEILPIQYATRTIYNRGGNGYLRRTINGLNLAARGIPFLVVTDLDDRECPQALISDWLTSPKHHNLLIRVAVREAEAWLLADKENFARCLGIRSALVPIDVESLPQPKEALVNLARNSSRKTIRDEICPKQNSTSKVGPNYNGRLSSFVQNTWDPVNAGRNCTSLQRTIQRLTDFRPIWPIQPVD